MSESKFDFNEVVRVVSLDEERRPIVGKTAVVNGKAFDDESGWVYSIWVSGLDECWFCFEDEMESLGRFEEDSESPGSVKIIVDKNGFGRFSSEDD